MSCAPLCVMFDCRRPLLEAQAWLQEVAHHGSVQAACVNARSAVGDQMGRDLVQEAQSRDLALEEAREAQGTPVAQAHGYGSIPIRCQIRNRYEK